MAVLVKDQVNVDTNIFVKSMNMVVNSVMEVLLEIIYTRRLDPNALLSLRKLLEDSMYIWLHEQKLQRIMLEVSLPESSDALEDWEFTFDYRDDPTSEVTRARTEEMARFGETLKGLPSGSVYRFLVWVAPGAKKIPGWEPTTAKPINPTVEKHFDKFGYGNISGQVFYKGGTW